MDGADTNFCRAYRAQSLCCNLVPSIGLTSTSGHENAVEVTTVRMQSRDRASHRECARGWRLQSSSGGREVGQALSGSRRDKASLQALYECRLAHGLLVPVLTNQTGLLQCLYHHLIQRFVPRERLQVMMRANAAATCFCHTHFSAIMRLRSMCSRDDRGKLIRCGTRAGVQRLRRAMPSCLTAPLFFSLLSKYHTTSMRLSCFAWG